MAKAKMMLRALIGMSLRQSADPADPKYESWYHWRAGETFAPPAHMDMRRALERVICEEVSDGPLSSES